MNCRTYDLWIQPGSTFNLTLTVTDSSGSPINLSGYNLQGGVKYNYGSTGFLVNLNPSNDPTITGQIDISVSANLTSGLPVTKGVYDIQAISSGYSFKILRGYANITSEVAAY